MVVSRPTPQNNSEDENRQVWVPPNQLNLALTPLIRVSWGPSSGHAHFLLALEYKCLHLKQQEIDMEATKEG